MARRARALRRADRSPHGAIDPVLLVRLLLVVEAVVGRRGAVSGLAEDGAQLRVRRSDSARDECTKGGADFFAYGMTWHNASNTELQRRNSKGAATTDAHEIRNVSVHALQKSALVSLP